MKKKYDPVEKRWMFTVGVGKNQRSVVMSDLCWKQLKKYHGGGLAAEKFVSDTAEQSNSQRVAFSQQIVK